MFHKQNVLLLITDKLANDVLIQHALHHAKNLNGKLYCRLVIPKFPQELASHETSYQVYLKDSMQNKIESVQNSNKEGIIDVEFDIDILSTKNANSEIINFAIQHSISFMIKTPETHDLGKGFCALDMSLLRESPIPVWLFQNNHLINKNNNLAVAIDASDTDPTSRKLSKKLLEVSGSLAKFNKGKLEIVSCWENFLDSAMLSSSWLNLSTSNIQYEIDSAKEKHKFQLEELIKEANLPSELSINVHIRNGLAVQQIPLFVEEEKIETLIMGTLARSGISGLVIGNTAESIVQKLKCSLIALKPDEFVSPHG